MSTDDQTEFSPDAQLRAIKEYAKRNDINLTRENIYIDEGISGRRAEKRPAFQMMIATAKSKPTPFEVILVHKFDRFARNREDSVVYKSLLKKDGVRVISITEHIEDDKFSVILEAMLEAMAEYYSLNLAEEVKKGMTEKAERGGYQSTPPFGYKMEDKKLVIVPLEAEIIKLIFQKFASGEMKMVPLAVYINSMGIKTKRGNPFESRTIEYILNNPVYLGKARWTPTGRTRRDYKNPDTIIRDSQHEPLVDLDTWNKVQERLMTNKEIYGKKEKTTTVIRTWLKGIVRCSACGYTLVAYQNKYMQCGGYLKGRCRQNSHIKISELEEIVLEELKKTYGGELEINIVPSASDAEHSNEFELLNDSLERITEKEARIKTAYEDGIDTLDEYKANKTRLTEERKSLKEALLLLKEALIENRHDEGITKKLASVYELLTDESISMENKYQTVHFLISQIVYSKPEMTLRLEYK